MFEIGFSEMVLVFVIALLVLGPEKLPGVVRQVARFIKKARAMADAVTRELQQELPVNEIKREVSSEVQAINAQVRSDKHE